MFGRLFILGQRDRIEVSEALGDPPIEVAKASHQWLSKLRASLKAGQNVQPLFTQAVAHTTLNALDFARENLAKWGFRAAPEPLRD
jgi:xanthine dehydrogenase molybdopterin-binding subunit B